MYPPGIIIAANPYAAGEFITEHPELSIALVLATGALVGTGIGALIQAHDVTRINSANGRIAQQIAQIEGRNPQTPAEINKAIEHVKQTVTVASRISPTPSHLFDLTFNHYIARLRSRKHPEVLEERSVGDRRMRKWSLRFIDIGEMGYPIEPQRVTDALILADRRWTNLIEDDGEPEYIRRYGRLMREEIQKNLAEYLTSPAWGEFERRRVRYQSMTPLEHGQELKRFIGNFPQSTFFSTFDFYAFDEDWQRRDESPEKKRLFEQIRDLISRSPGTRGFQEVLLQELGYLYNGGLELDEASNLPVMSVSLLEAVCLGETGEYVDEGSIFDPERCEEVERRLYRYVQEERRIKWNPRRYDAFDESKPIKRWLLNRREDGFQVIDIVFNKLMPPSTLEQSWQRQYKAKYKKKLKPL